MNNILFLDAPSRHNERNDFREKIKGIGITTTDSPENNINPNIIFIHGGDVTLGNDISNFINSKPSIWKIYYGDKDSKFEIDFNGKAIKYINFKKVEANFDKFYEKVKDGIKREDGDEIKKWWEILVGFDPILEVQLELLHQCLTPEGAAIADKIKNYPLIKDKVEKIKVGEKTIVEHLSKQSDCFDDENYIKPLTKLRDALLNS